MKHKLRAAIYARFSVDRKGDSSISQQLEVCREYAEREQLNVTATFTDAGISGAATGNRPGFLAMRASAKRQDFEVLLLMDTTRLSRSHDLAAELTRLRHHGLHVLGVQDGYDSEAPTADMQAGMSGLMSVEFRKMIIARTRAALLIRARSKRKTGGRAYGYASKDEARTLAFIFKQFVAGWSPRRLAAELNSRRVPSPGAAWKRKKPGDAGMERVALKRTDGKWLASAIYGILRNERYRGVVTFNKTRWNRDPDTGIRSCVERPRSEWVVTEQPDLRRIDNATWEAAQARIQQTYAETTQWKKGNGRSPRRVSQYLLSGLLVCAECGSRYVMTNKYKYACSSHVNGGQAACANGARVSRAVAEKAILETLRNDLMTPARVKAVVAHAEKKLNRDLNATEAARSVERERLAQLDREIENMTDAIAGGLNSPALSARLQAAENERTKAVALPARKAKVAVLFPTAVKEYERLVSALPATLAKDPDRAKAALRRLFDEIRLVPARGGGLNAELKFPVNRLLSLVNAAPKDCVGSGGRI